MSQKIPNDVHNTVVVKSPEFDSYIWPDDSQTQYCFECMNKAHRCTCITGLLLSQESTSDSDEVSEHTSCDKCEYLAGLLGQVKKVLTTKQSATKSLEDIKKLF